MYGLTKVQSREIYWGRIDAELDFVRFVNFNKLITEGIWAS
jgi:hypothetical protein